jgi:hypothetical protein
VIILRLCFAALVIIASANDATARLARCLVEVDGKTLISGQCAFDPLDASGSFKVSADNGASAEVHIAGKDASATFRSRPQGGGVDLGAVGRDGGCWAPLSNLDRKTKICAFAGADFNVEPDPHVDKSAILYWGVRLGMFDQIDRQQDLGSAHAMIRTVPSRAAAIIYCREFARDYTQVCIAKAQAARRPQELTADCPRNTFTGFNGWRVAYIGPNFGAPSVAPPTKYLFKDLASGQLLDGSEASNYSIAEAIFAVLCPKIAPPPEE